MIRETCSLPRETDEWVARLRQIPDTYRTFDVDLRRAEAEFGLDDRLARALIERGMPHEPHDGEWRFADTDLHYVGLRLGRANVYRTAMRSWAQALMSSAASTWTMARVRYLSYAAPGSQVEVLIPPDHRVRTTTEADRTAARVEARMQCRWPSFDPAVHDILEDVGSLDFCLVPEPLDVDSGFVRRTRLASCASAAHLIVEECTRLGIEARTAFGLLLASPLGTPRNWAEIRDGDSWLPADPLLLETLRAYAGLDAQAWPATRCPGAILLRLGGERTAIVSADGRTLAASFVTSLSSAESEI